MCWLSWAEASSVKNSAQEGDVGEYAYPAGKWTIWAHCAPELLPVWVGGISGRGGVSSGVGCLRLSGGGAPLPLGLYRVCGFFGMAFRQGRHPAIWFRRSVAGFFSIAAFSCLGPGNSTPRFFSSRTSARGFLNRNCVSSIAVREKPPLAIFATFKARRMSDCSNCTRPPCLAIVADMLKTYKKIVAACNDEIRRLPQPYTLPSSKANKACFIQSCGFLSGNTSAEIRELTTS